MITSGDIVTLCLSEDPSLFHANYLVDTNVQFRIGRTQRTITTSYTPDFWLPEEKCYYEIKGWMDDISQLKIREFKECHPEIVLHIVEHPEYETMMYKYKRLISEWE